MARAGELGENLGIETGIMSGLRLESGVDPNRLLSLVITYWLDNDIEQSWQKLANALELSNQKKIADDLRRQKGMVSMYTHFRVLE